MFQELQDTPGAMVQLLLNQSGGLHHLYQNQCLAVSHRWREDGCPDPSGEQLRAIRAYVLAHDEIRFVWYDYWCMPQCSCGMGSMAACTCRPEEDKAAFKHMLKHCNYIYLGCRVPKPPQSLAHHLSNKTFLELYDVP